MKTILTIHNHLTKRTISLSFQRTSTKLQARSILQKRLKKRKKTPDRFPFLSKSKLSTITLPSSTLHYLYTHTHTHARIFYSFPLKKKASNPHPQKCSPPTHIIIARKINDLARPPIAPILPCNQDDGWIQMKQVHMHRVERTRAHTHLDNDTPT